LNSRSDVIFTQKNFGKKFTWADLGGINTDIPPSLRPWFLFDPASPMRVFIHEEQNALTTIPRGYTGQWFQNSRPDSKTNSQHRCSWKHRCRHTTWQNKTVYCFSSAVGVAYAKEVVGNSYSAHWANAHFGPGNGSLSATNVVLALLGVVVRFSMYWGFFISQPMVVKLRTQIGNNITRNHTVSDFSS